MPRMSHHSFCMCCCRVGSVPSVSNSMPRLPHNPASLLVFVAEWIVSRVPATAAKAQLLLDLAARQPQEGQFASWMLPLAANALLNAAPPAAPHLWLQVVHLLPVPRMCMQTASCELSLQRFGYWTNLLLFGHPVTMCTRKGLPSFCCCACPAYMTCLCTSTSFVRNISTVTTAGLCLPAFKVFTALDSCG